MSQALAPHWTGPGRELTVSGRTADKAERLAAKLDANVTSWRTGADHADVVLLGVHWAGVNDVLSLAGADDGALAGKVIVDCGNPVEIERFTLVDPGRSLAQKVQDRTGARVVKAFNLCHAHVWQQVPDYDGRTLKAPIAGDDDEAKDLVATLVTDVGAEPLDVGDLEQAAHLEAMAAIIIRHLFSGADPTTVFNLVDAPR